MNNLKNTSIALIAVLTLGGSFLSACHSDKKEKEEQAQTIKQENAVDTPSVVPVLVKKGKLSNTIALPGELLPYQQVDLYAKVSSYVKTLLVDIGSEVHRGQLLITLDCLVDMGPFLVSFHDAISQHA